MEVDEKSSEAPAPLPERDRFSGVASTDGFWRSVDADAAMQRGNACAWEAMASIEGLTLTGASVIDIGCNMGAFLRFLHDEHGIGRALGLDTAASTIEAAQELNGDRPITYVASPRPPAGWPEADLAFSQEVMYLIHDLAEHADDVWNMLRPGGTYFAVTSVHRESQLMTEWHATNHEALGMPPLRSIGEYLEPFVTRGFTAELGRLHIRAVPVHGDELERAWDLLQFWTRTNDKVLFRLRKPDAA
jgi:SAM-dependent methyltransferase